MDEESILNASNEAYNRLRADDDAWEHMLAERAEWDDTLLDGMDDGEPEDDES